MTFIKNKIRRNLQTIINIIIFRFKKKITLINKKFILNVIFKLIYLDKINFMHHKGVKKNINLLYMDITTKVKQSKSDIKYVQKVKSIAGFIITSTSKFNILTFLDNIIGLNLKAILLTIDLIIYIYLKICKDENISDLVILSIFFILIDVYDKLKLNYQYILPNIILNTLQFILEGNYYS